MIFERIKPVAAVIFGAMLVWAMLAIAFAGYAHAQAATPPPAVAVVSTGLQIEAWILILVAAFTGLTMVFAGIRTALAVIAPRTATTLDDRALQRVVAIEEGLRAIVTLLTGGRDPVPLPVAPPRRSEGGFAARAVMLSLACGALIAAPVALNACAARERVAAGTKAFLDCQYPNVDTQLLDEAKTVAMAAVERLLTGVGPVNLDALRDAARPLRSDLMRCAMDGAIAAFLMPTSAARTSTGAETYDQRRAAWNGVRAELGWPPAAP